MSVARAALVGATIALSLLAAGCGGAPSSRDATSTRIAMAAAPRASWYGAVVEEEKDLVVTLSPARLMRDAAYGPIFQRASRLAAATSPGTQLHGTTLEALEQSESIVLCVKEGAPLDAVLIVGGVPAAVDAARLADAEGQPLWRASHQPPVGGVVELERATPSPSTNVTADDAALFVVPGRTWILATGLGRERVRDALVRSAPAAAYVADAHPLLSVTLGGAVIRRIRARVGPALAPLADGLQRAEATFGPGERGEVGASFFYDDARHATNAHERAEDVIRLLAEKLAPHLDFLRLGALTRTERVVKLTARLPPALLKRFAEVEELPGSP